MAAPAHSGQEPQGADAVLMLRRPCFELNPETADSNAFQQAADSPDGTETQRLVLAEFDGLARALLRAGVEVLIAPDTPHPVKPDAIFPNNWVSFHFDGTVALYPMLAPNRRSERREDVLAQVVREGRFHVSRTVDLTHREAEGKILQGNRSLLLE